MNRDMRTAVVAVVLSVSFILLVFLVSALVTAR